MQSHSGHRPDTTKKIPVPDILQCLKVRGHGIFVTVYISAYNSSVHTLRSKTLYFLSFKTLSV